MGVQAGLSKGGHGLGSPKAQFGSDFHCCECSVDMLVMSRRQFIPCISASKAAEVKQ